MRMVLNVLKSVCTSGWGASSIINMDLSCIGLFTSYCCDVAGEKDEKGISKGLSVRSSCVRRMRAMEDIPRRRCIMESIVVHTRQ